MNRIRKKNGIYEVLITPNITMSVEVGILMGKWEEIREYEIKEYETLQEALCEAYKYSEINWYKIVENHKYIYERIKKDIEKILKKNKYMTDVRYNIMTPEEVKEMIFERTRKTGERLNIKEGKNDIINIEIVNPWTENLRKISKSIEEHKEHLHRDDIRIIKKQVIDKKIIILLCMTELGTTYEIKLIPTLLNYWNRWVEKKSRNEKIVDKIYKEYLESQEEIDNKTILR